MAEIIKSLFCENLEQSSIFQAVKKETAEATYSLMQTIEKAIPETEKRKIYQSEAMRVCRQYQLDGYLKGINEGIKLANTITGTKIQITDIDTGQQVL